MSSLKSIFNIVWIQHLLFWICVFLFSVFSSSMALQMGARQTIEIYGTILLCQIIAATVCLRFLIPQFLNKKKTIPFILSLVLLMLLLFALYIMIRMHYLEIAYFDYYHKIMPEYIQLGFWERLFEFRVFLSKGIRYLSPTAFLLLMRYYKNQQNYLALKEQKKTAELSALKSQLNPHFLFNTLNNLYTLALKKSDKTPEVISKLSDILDYMLYRCNDKFVSLNQEIGLIENYIALEKIRYGKRVKVSFNNSADGSMTIAPLILLTFIENAFKHGVSQEINEAALEVSLKSEANSIQFSMRNTTPSSNPQITRNKNSIGLVNVKKQLELLYPGRHELKINQTERHYSVQLKLDSQ